MHMSHIFSTLTWILSQTKLVRQIKQASIGRKKVEAVCRVQRVYRGHVGRQKYDVVLEERRRMQPSIDAADMIKSMVLRYAEREM
jgi:hypothetical protein